MTHCFVKDCTNPIYHLGLYLCDVHAGITGKPLLEAEIAFLKAERERLGKICTRLEIKVARYSIQSDRYKEALEKLANLYRTKHSAQAKIIFEALHPNAKG